MTLAHVGGFSMIAITVLAYALWAVHELGWKGAAQILAVIIFLLAWGATIGWLLS